MTYPVPHSRDSYWTDLLKRIAEIRTLEKALLPALKPIHIDYGGPKL